MHFYWITAATSVAMSLRPRAKGMSPSNAADCISRSGARASGDPANASGHCELPLFSCSLIVQKSVPAVDFLPVGE
jgi:hypothetical protein